MSHSRVFDEYAKIMSEKCLLKTADKKDPDYNVVPDKAGLDPKVDKTGYELTEIAHPEQIQVAESHLNDGIVENGLESQKTMTEIALRNPRGVLASVMKSLVKAATILDAEMSDESIEMASEIDAVIAKLAQQQVTTLPAEYDGLLKAAATAANSIVNFDFDGFFYKYFLSWARTGNAKQKAQEFSMQVFEYISEANNALDDAEKIKHATALAQYGLSQASEFRKLMQAQGEEWWQATVDKAWQGMNEFERQAKLWMGKVLPSLQNQNRTVPPPSAKIMPAGEYNIPAGMSAMQGKPSAGEVRVIDHPEIQWDGQKWGPTSPPPDAQVIGMPGTKMERAKWDKRLGLWLVPTMANVRPTDMASKMPQGAHSASYSVQSPQVKELQKLLGVEADSKFGPITFKALMEKAKGNSLLSALLRGNPELTKGYQSWKNNADIGSALQRIQQGNESVNLAQNNK